MNLIKQKTNKKENRVGFKERDIFWLRLGQNIGAEEYGKGNEFQRPVLIVKRLTYNIFIGVPLTSSLKTNDYFHQFVYKTKKGDIENSAMINKSDFELILEKISILFIPSKK